MVNYANGKVYKIESSLGDKIYIGSTTKEQLSQRMSSHRADYKKWKNGKGRKTNSFLLFNEYGLKNCKIVLLEDCPCETKDQLSSREAHHIRTLDCINKVIPLRTPREYENENREKIRGRQKVFREENKEKLAEKMRAYRKAKKENTSQ